MPKLKRSKSVVKRVKITKHGKIRINKSGTSHLMTSKSGNKKRKLKKFTFLAPAQAKMVRRAIR